MALDQVASDSLEAALAEMPCLVCRRGWLAHPNHDPSCGVWQPDPPALAAAAEKWMRERMPPRDSGHAGSFAHADIYNECLADVALALGLEETT